MTTQFITSVTDGQKNQFAKEEVKSSYGYLSGYKKPKSIIEQVQILRRLFPGIGYTDEKIEKQSIPLNAEGHFTIPRWEKIAPTYGEAVRKVLDMIKNTKNGMFCNYRKDQLSSEHLHQSVKSVQAFQKIGDEQKGYNILVVAAQFGINHRGRSVRRALEIMDSSEFALGVFAVVIMLLTHPERLQDYDDLWINCAGDEFRFVADGRFLRAPCFHFSGGRVRFVSNLVDKAHVGYGSASAFVA